MASLSRFSSTVNCHCHCHCHGGFKDNNIRTATIMAALPDEILAIIVNKLDLVEFHRIGAVCRLWRQFLFKPQFLKPQFPWLMLSFSESKRDIDHQGFFSAFHGKVYNLEMPKIPGARCCGSTWGWLIMLGNVEEAMFLYNPFTKVRIALPPQSTLPLIPYFEGDRLLSNYIRKAMLVSPDSTSANNFNLDENKLKLIGSSGSLATIPDDCLVVALYFRYYLAFCRPGDQGWKHPYVRFSSGLEDIIVCDGRLYAIKHDYDLILLELLPWIRETSCNIAPPPVIDLETLVKNLYLVESHGELLMIIRWIKLDSLDPYDSTSPTTTVMFWIFKLDLQQLCWVKVEDLGDQMLFIGRNTCISCSALHYNGFKGNSIYFTDDYSDHIRNTMDLQRTPCDDLGVFQLEDKSIKFNFYPTYCHSHASPPIWIEPISWHR